MSREKQLIKRTKRESREWGERKKAGKQRKEFRVRSRSKEFKQREGRERESRDKRETAERAESKNLQFLIFNSKKQNWSYHLIEAKSVPRYWREKVFIWPNLSYETKIVFWRVGVAVKSDFSVSLCLFSKGKNQNGQRA